MRRLNLGIDAGQRSGGPEKFRLMEGNRWSGVRSGGRGKAKQPQKLRQAHRLGQPGYGDFAHRPPQDLHQLPDMSHSLKVRHIFGNLVLFIW